MDFYNIPSDSLISGAYAISGILNKGESLPDIHPAITIANTDNNAFFNEIENRINKIFSNR